MMSELGEVEMDVWMHDKLTLAADYISAVADNALFGDGVELEVEEEEGMAYGEKKGLWANIHAKRKRIKAGSGERMRKPGSKGAPSAKDLKDSQSKDTSDNAEKKADKDYDRDGKIESPRDEYFGAKGNAIAKKKKAEAAGIKFKERPDYPDVDKDGDRKESMESAVKNAKAKKKKAKKAGIKID